MPAIHAQRHPTPQTPACCYRRRHSSSNTPVKPRRRRRRRWCRREGMAPLRGPAITVFVRATQHCPLPHRRRLLSSTPSLTPPPLLAFFDTTPHGTPFPPHLFSLPHPPRHFFSSSPLLPSTHPNTALSFPPSLIFFLPPFISSTNPNTSLFFLPSLYLQHTPALHFLPSLSLEHTL